MKQGNVRALIEYLSAVICNSDPDSVPLTFAPVVKVQHSEPVPLSALQQQSEKARGAMEEKRKRALSFLATHTGAARRPALPQPIRRPGP
jgi:hypothetical protein